MVMFATQRTRFETVVRAYANDVFRYLYWLCRDRSLAEDLSQETFSRAWAAWEESGRAFWTEMDAVLDMLDGLVIESDREVANG